VPPLAIACEGQDAGEELQESVRAPRTQERTVRAVVEDREDAGEESRSEDGCREREPVGNGQRPNHEAPQREVGDNRVHDLPDAAAQHRFLAGRDRLLPGRRCRWRVIPLRRLSCSRGMTHSRRRDRRHRPSRLVEIERISQILQCAVVNRAWSAASCRSTAGGGSGSPPPRHRRARSRGDRRRLLRPNDDGLSQAAARGRAARCGPGAGGSCGSPPGREPGRGSESMHRRDSA